MSDGKVRELETVKYDVKKEPIVIFKEVMDMLLAQPKPAELIALFCFYYHTAKWQDTKIPKATNSYCAKGLKWTVRKVSKVSKRLSDLSLIKRKLCRKDDNTGIGGHYVELDINPFLNKCFINMVPTASETYSVQKRSTNASKNNTLNAVSIKRERKVSAMDVNSLYDLPPNYYSNKSLRKTWREFVDYRSSTLKRPLTVIAWKKIIKKMSGYSHEEIVEGLNTAMECSWRAPFFKHRRTFGNPIRSISTVDVKIPRNIKRQVKLLKETIKENQESYHTIDKKELVDTVLSVKSFYDSIPTKDGEDVPNTSWNKFFKDWVEFVRGRKEGWKAFSYSTRSWYWKDFLHTEQRNLGVNFRTGRRV